MVRAIRFWGLAAKLITEDPQHSGRRETSCVSPSLLHIRLQF